jgi:hypothetical protein
VLCTAPCASTAPRTSNWDPVPPTTGFQLTRDTAPFKTPDRTDTVNSWTPPCLNSSVQTNERTGRSLVLTFYGVPVAPGKSRVITAFFTNGKVRQTCPVQRRDSRRCCVVLQVGCRRGPPKERTGGSGHARSATHTGACLPCCC